MNATLEYFRFFKYAPTLDQYHLFQKEKMDKSEIVQRIERDKELIITNSRVAYKSDIHLIELSEMRSIISQRKLESKHRFLRFLGLIPLIQFIGVSGSVAAGNAKEDDDVDVFIISRAGWLWTTRFFILLISSLLGARRYPKDTKYKDKLCFNLFFDESDLAIPQDKQTEYVGHEVLQLVPVVNKNGTYENFFSANNWVIKLFPNARDLPFPRSLSFSRMRESIPGSPGFHFVQPEDDKIGFIESLFMKFQLFIMRKNRTTERITNTQLWFFPDDFEKRMVK